MTFALGPLTLADVWRPFLHPRVVALSFPAVPGIDCDNCRMEKMGYFSGATKCCTYTPEFPNFLVGQMLHDDAAPPLVESWVSGRGDPLFLYAPPAHKRAHQIAAAIPRNALPCPLLVEGRCTAYAYRPYLCSGYHCAYPSTPSYKAFWNALVSLLALHSAIAAQLVMEALGKDRGAFIDTWNTIQNEEDVWHDGALSPEFKAALWQGSTDARAFYVSCYAYVRDHAATIRAELDTFRRAQLLRVLEGRGVLSEGRAREIHEQASEPHATQLPAMARAAFERGVVVFAEHLWTVPEHESYVLQLHAEAFAS